LEPNFEKRSPIPSIKREKKKITIKSKEDVMC
jgi:hypothetical protein